MNNHLPAQTAPGKGITWRPRGASEVLGSRRCNAVGLILGDCSQLTYGGEAYCFYHSKVRSVAVSHHEANTEAGLTEVPPTHYYPVWPLPATGYILLDQREAVA